MYALAQIVLYSWPLVTWVLFRKLRPEPALIATILLGYLFIPERVGFDPPVLPPINKHSMPVLCGLIAMWLVRRRAADAAARAARKAGETAGPTARTKGGRAILHPRGSRITLIIPLIIGVLMLNAVLGWLGNRDPLYFARRVIPGLGTYDIGMLWSTLLIALLPLFAGARFLRSRESQIDLLKVLAWSGFAYSFLVLIEVRISPKLNIMLYGFFAHNWVQHLRGGFRPIVFLEHGLRVGIFLAMAVLATAVLAHNNVDGRRKRWIAIMLWTLLSLSLSHNFGAMMIAVGLLPFILFAPARIQFLAGLVIAVVVLLYPLARGSGLIPTERIVAAVADINADRAGSLQFRLNNEDALLERANLKPVSGWGGWGRYLIFDEQTGERESIPDGSWIIVIGNSGWIGYLGTFGLLCLPLILAAMRRKRYAFTAVEGGFILVLGANLIDLIPNSSLLPPLWLMAGTLWGRLEQASTQSAKERLARGAARGRTARIHKPAVRHPPLQRGNSTPSNT